MSGRHLAQPEIMYHQMAGHTIDSRLFHTSARMFMRHNPGYTKYTTRVQYTHGCSYTKNGQVARTTVWNNETIHTVSSTESTTQPDSFKGARAHCGTHRTSSIELEPTCKSVDIDVLFLEIVSLSFGQPLLPKPHTLHTQVARTNAAADRQVLTRSISSTSPVSFLRTFTIVFC